MQDTGYLKITRHLLKVTFEKWVVFVLFDVYTTFTKPFHQLIQPIISRNLHPNCTEKPSSTVGKIVSCQKSSRVEVQNTKNVHQKTHLFFLNSLPIYVVVFLSMLTSCFLAFLNKKKSWESVSTYKVWPIRTNSCFMLLCVEGEPLLAPRIFAHCVEEVVFVCKCWIC